LVEESVPKRCEGDLVAAAGVSCCWLTVEPDCVLSNMSLGNVLRDRRQVGIANLLQGLPKLLSICVAHVSGIFGSRWLLALIAEIDVGPRLKLTLIGVLRIHGSISCTRSAEEVPKVVFLKDLVARAPDRSEAVQKAAEC
jgi:hypothetical protein